MPSSWLLGFFFLKTVKNKMAQVVAMEIKLKITIHAISPSLRPLLSDKHTSDIFDLFRTSNVSFEYVKMIYIYSNNVHH